MDADGRRRRRLLALLAGAGAAGLAGCSGDGGSADTATAEPVEEETARELAERYAPTLYFDENETWFPTDPRPYATERDGRRVVPGFDAVEGYLQRYEDAGGDPPDPTVFYRAVQYDGALTVVQYWLYSAFDQFTANFHWHDWELLQVFVDAESGEPQLFVASSHSRKVPNNEFLDPETAPRVLTELGSHSSGLSVNDAPERFQRLPDGETLPDVTNQGLDAVARLSDFPMAYGLPRDEGSRLPYVVPELDGQPVYEHPDLPTFERDHLVPPELTIRSFDALSSPPTALPTRSTGVQMDPEGGDHPYELVPASEVEDIEEYAGPQLSFEFAVPAFVEDAVASHITAAGTPHEQPRYDDPIADVTDPGHRAALSERYDVVTARGLAASVVATLSQVTAEEDAPDGEGVTTTSLGIEGVGLLESDPELVPTFGGGVLAARDVPEGEHRLTVNAAGVAPYSERVEVGGADATETGGNTGTDDTTETGVDDDAVTETGDDDDDDTVTSATATGTPEVPGVALAGVGGELPVVPRGESVKLELDAEGTDRDLERFRVADDFGGALYDAPVDGPDAVYVHRGGAYTAEVRDAEGRPGAFRVNPGAETRGRTRIEEPRTGKASLAEYLVDLFAETREFVEANTDGGKTGGLLQALEAVEESARRALEAAESGNPRAADQRIDAVIQRVGNVTEALADAALPDPAERAVRRRSEIGREKARQAKETGL